MAEFNLAFPKLIKWAINTNQYAESEKDAMAGYVDIPVIDIQPLIQHLQALQFDASKHENRPVWNFEKGQNEQLPTVRLKFKGRIGKDGTGGFGNFNPPKINVQPVNEEIPF